MDVLVGYVSAVFVNFVNSFQMTILCVCIYIYICRSQWPRGLRHELSSLARKLGSCVRIPFKAWMSVYAFIPCLCCPVYR
jgi:hypothetical protein